MLEPSEISGRRYEEPPRANLLVPPGELCVAGIWMGGAHTMLGTSISLEVVERAWVFDLAGDMPPAYRSRAKRWVSRVFADIDSVPREFEGLRATVREMAKELEAGTGPEGVYVMCQHGMNRSGLVSGLLLRELGMSGSGAIERIVQARPGSLSNVAFRRLVEGS